jgi:photolyase PhrII
VRDQLAQRVTRVNETRLVPEGDVVLYWMQSTHRLHDNWALRFATMEADRLNRPLIIFHELAPDYQHASDRFHTFALQGAKEVAREAAALGYVYRFVLRYRNGGDARALHRLASRACLVVTDAAPTGGIRERTERFASVSPCRVLAVDSIGIVPAAMIAREEYAARTIRPKLAKLRDVSLEPVADRPPKRAPSASLLAALDIDTLDIARADIAAEVARCDIDHSVGAVSTQGGLSPARERLSHFVHTGLQRYRARRKEPADLDGSSRLSPFLRFGQISPAEVARTALAYAPAEEAEAFLDEMVTWRELSLNFCLHNPFYASLDSLPLWVRRSMDEHADDPREVVYSLEELEGADTHDALWNAGQRELVTSGYLHNAVRMLWGKSVLLWSATYADALERLLHLNDRYALDGRDPNSYANIMWCFGKFDRPFAARPVWGTIRPMSLARAKGKFDVERYVSTWAQQLVETE